MGKQDADFVENLFVATVGVPLAIMAATGMWFAIANGDGGLPVSKQTLEGLR